MNVRRLEHPAILLLRGAERLERLVRRTRLDEPAERILRTFRRDGPRYARDHRLMSDLLSRTLTATSNCIEIGAQRGGFLKRILAVAPEGYHHAFEAIPKAARELAGAFPTVDVHQLAVSDHNGEAALHVRDQPWRSGLRRPAHPSDAEAAEISVDVRRLDDVIPEEYRVDLVKIDIAGAELSALRGGAELLRRCRPHVIFEHVLTLAHGYGVTSADMHRFFSSLDFGIYRLDGVGPMSEAAFAALCDAADASGYGPSAHTTFVANPVRSP